VAGRGAWGEIGDVEDGKNAIGRERRTDVLLLKLSSQVALGKLGRSVRDLVQREQGDDRP
jgi:hypothetical protein